MSTATLLAVLRTDTAQYDENEGAGSRSILYHRPAGLALLNDGVWHYWMLSGNIYRLHYDGHGWRVTCAMWAGDHTYRLIDTDARYAGELPTTDGPRALQSGSVYELRERYPAGPWEIYTT